ncbi:hypothetical protein [Streptomyces acidiscabies]|nr:hypothetical protein [Streptomyces acidiscabies]
MEHVGRYGAMLAIPQFNGVVRVRPVSASRVDMAAVRKEFADVP